MFLLLWNEAVALESSSDDGSDQDYVQSAPVISSYVCVCVCVCVCLNSKVWWWVVSAVMIRWE